MRTFVLLIVLTVALAIPGMGSSSATTASPSLLICSGPGEDCRAGSLSDTARLGRNFEVRRRVQAPMLRSPLPIAVTVIAMADSEVRWNGRTLARNGDPDGSGRSGQFVFTVIVPPARVRPGVNEAVVRFKRPRDLWRVASPVHAVSVAPYTDPRHEALRRYLPALLTGSALAAAALWFGLTFAFDRTERGARLLALATAGAVIQLGFETARAFVDYRHVWQPYRLAVIAILSAFVGLMLVRYAAWRFAPAARNAITLACALLSGLILVLAEGFDVKTLAAFQLCLIAITGLAGWALYRGTKVAGLALAGAALALMWSLHDGTGFLDKGYYLALGVVVLTLAIEQASSQRRRTDPAVTDSENALSQNPLTLRVITGAKFRLEPLDTIACLTAADDYTEVSFTDGRTCLHTENLSKTVQAGSGAFMRIHRSHAVNLHLVIGSKSRAGGRLWLILKDGASVPVGRTFQRAVRQALEPGSAHRRPSSPCDAPARSVEPADP